MLPLDAGGDSKREEKIMQEHIMEAKKHNPDIY